MCVGYVVGLEDAHDTGRVTSAQTRRYLGELLTFRNTALRGYLELVELMEWLETPEGQQQTVGLEGFVQSTKDHMARLERARSAFEGLRR